MTKELIKELKRYNKKMLDRVLASQRKKIIKEVTEDLVNLEATGKQVLIKEIIEKIEKNCSEYDGEWHMKAEDGNCKKFTMSELKTLIKENE